MFSFSLQFIKNDNTMFGFKNALVNVEIKINKCCLLCFSS